MDGNGSQGNNQTLPLENRQPPRLDPAELQNMLGNLHAAEEMMPPPGEQGGDFGRNGPGEQPPDFSRLSGLGGDSAQMPPPPDLSALHGVLDQLGDDAAGPQSGDSGAEAEMARANDLLSQYKSALRNGLGELGSPGTESDPDGLGGHAGEGGRVLSGVPKPGDRSGTAG
ncbi:hypothetical protein ACW9HQ_52070, partial [Nocardia gipuzkoensis]